MWLFYCCFDHNFPTFLLKFHNFPTYYVCRYADFSPHWLVHHFFCDGRVRPGVPGLPDDHFILVQKYCIQIDVVCWFSFIYMFIYDWVGLHLCLVRSFLCSNNWVIGLAWLNLCFAFLTLFNLFFLETYSFLEYHMLCQ